MQISRIKKLTQEIFNAADRGFGDYLLRVAGEDNWVLFISGALLINELRSGRIGIRLQEFAGRELASSGEEKLILPDYETWCDELEYFPEVIAFGSIPPETVPLILADNGRLMLRRYAVYEDDVRRNLLRRRRFASEPEFFHRIVNREPDLQDLAVFTVLNSRLMILSGGPGTGKTTVCGRILEELLCRDPGMQIVFAAPTGKAQQRFASQIRESAARVPGEALRDVMKQVSGGTIHSLLYRSNMREKLENCDVFIIDECSMVSLELFVKLLNILPGNAKLILIGDSCQLSSVESGGVFGDLCRAAEANTLVPQGAAVFNGCGGKIAVADGKLPFSGYLVELRTNYRSRFSPGICRIAAALRESDGTDAAALGKEIMSMRQPDFTSHIVNSENCAAMVRRQLGQVMPESGVSFRELPGLCASGDEEKFQRAMKLINEFKFICCTNKGKTGVDEINALILKELAIVPAAGVIWHPGTVLLIKENDRITGLRNGDIGLVVRLADGSSAVIIAGDETGTKYKFSGLPEHGCGFALTVHKAQGSGYDNVVFILPDAESGVLCRELIYTGITRAARGIAVWGGSPVLTAAIARKLERGSNLFCPEKDE